ncbi:MAG: HIRAN domain-containing protein [Agathobacter sp.]|nr:HIRAN domain-containing protein [Agathobacter sp.]
MSLQNGKDYLYLIWQDSVSRRQFIVGQLSKNGEYEFRYSDDISLALNAGFQPLVAFEDISKTYYSDKLFPAFASRLPDCKRKDIDAILQKYGLQEYDAYQLLKASGARLPIDHLKFVDPILDIADPFERDFYMAGTRHYLGCDGENCDQSLDITRGDELFLKKEISNPYDEYAVEVQTKKGEKIGYVPRYYSQAFSRILDENRSIRCHAKFVDKNSCCSECVLLHVNVS